MYDKMDEYWIDLIQNIMFSKSVPDRYDEDELNNIENYFFNRSIYTTLCSWCLVSNSFVDSLYNNLLKGKKVLSIYSGRGLLDYHLKERGLDIISTDNNSWYDPESKNTREARLILQFHTGLTIENQVKKYMNNIEDISAVPAVEKYAKDVDYILASWVPCGDEAICRVVSCMKYYNPECKLVWIGESEYGCNGCDEFFEIVEYEYDDNIELINNSFQRWNGIHDQVILYK